MTDSPELKRWLLAIGVGMAFGAGGALIAVAGLELLWSWGVALEWGGDKAKVLLIALLGIPFGSATGLAFANRLRLPPIVSAWWVWLAAGALGTAVAMLMLWLADAWGGFTLLALPFAVSLVGELAYRLARRRKRT